MSTTILFNEEAKAKLKVGIDTVANAVKVTLGAAGRNVVIGTSQGLPINTKDGVTVAKAVFMDDPTEQMGALAVKEAAGRTVDEAGDGTTTASVLVQEMITGGLESINAGHSANAIKTGMEKATKIVIKEIQYLSRDITSLQELSSIARISANNDAELGDLIAEAWWKAGADGEVTFEESPTTKTYVTMVEGMKLGSGLFHHVFINNDRRPVCELNDPAIFITDLAFNTVGPIKAMLETAFATKRPLLIIASVVEGDALTTILNNVVMKKIQCAVVIAPEYGKLRKDILEDVAAFTGGQFFSKDLGQKPPLNFETCGRCEKVVIDGKNTVIIKGGGDVTNRVNAIKTLMESATNDIERKQFSTRIARLSGSVGVLSVGGQTQSEVNDKKFRADDAIFATKAALKEGYVAGGGTTYLFAAEKIDECLDFRGDESVGAQIVKNALLKPFVQNLENGGMSNKFKEGGLFGKTRLVSDGIVASPYGEGIDMRSGARVNLFSKGIIDPTKVVRVALENASSVAAMFLITECTIAEKK